jgi:hypothetical protein
VACRPPASNTWQETGVLPSLVHGFLDYREQNQGQLATNWTQLATVVHLDYLNSERLTHSSAYPLQSNYVFLTNGVRLPPHSTREIVLLRSKPIQRNNPAQLGRFLILRDGTNYSWSWVAEDVLKPLLEAAKVEKIFLH